VAAYYPHDVLAGLLLGTATSVAGYLLVRRVLTRLITALQGTVLRPLLTNTPPPAEKPVVTESVLGDPVTAPALPGFLGALAPLLDQYGISRSAAGAGGGHRHPRSR
jgi:hypothetical protein